MSSFRKDSPPSGVPRFQATLHHYHRAGSGTAPLEKSKRKRSSGWMRLVLVAGALALIGVISALLIHFSV